MNYKGLQLAVFLFGAAFLIIASLVGFSRYFGVKIDFFTSSATYANPQRLVINPLAGANPSALKKGDSFEALTFGSTGDRVGNFTLAVKYTYTPYNQPTQYKQSLDWAVQDASGRSVHQITDYSPDGVYQITAIKDSRSAVWVELGSSGPLLLVGSSSAVGKSADIQANGSNGPLYANYNGTAKISWTSSGYSVCSISPALNGISSGLASPAGGVNTFILTALSNVYNLICDNTVRDSVEVRVPPPPTNPSASCPALGTSATVSWTPAPGYSTHYLRVYDSTVYPTYPPAATVVYIDNFVGSKHTFTAIPGHQYTWWVHTKEANGTYSQSVPIGPTPGPARNFVCAKPLALEIFEPVAYDVLSDMEKIRSRIIGKLTPLNSSLTYIGNGMFLTTNPQYWFEEIIRIIGESTGGVIVGGFAFAYDNDPVMDLDSIFDLIREMNNRPPVLTPNFSPLLKILVDNKILAYDPATGKWATGVIGGLYGFAIADKDAALEEGIHLLLGYDQQAKEKAMAAWNSLTFYEQVMAWATLLALGYPHAIDEWGTINEWFAKNSGYTSAYADFNKLYDAFRVDVNEGFLTYAKLVAEKEGYSLYDLRGLVNFEYDIVTKKFRISFISSQNNLVIVELGELDIADIFNAIYDSASVNPNPASFITAMENDVLNDPGSVVTRIPLGSPLSRRSLGFNFDVNSYSNGYTILYDTKTGKYIQVFPPSSSPLNQSAPPLATQLSDGTWEYIFSNGLRVIRSADQTKVLFSGYANYTVVNAAYSGISVYISSATGYVTLQNYPGVGTIRGVVVKQDLRTLSVLGEDGSKITIWKNGSGTVRCLSGGECSLYNKEGALAYKVDANGNVTNPSNGWNGNNPFDASRAWINLGAMSRFFTTQGICYNGCGQVSGWVMDYGGTWHQGGYMWPNGAWSPGPSVDPPPPPMKK